MRTYTDLTNASLYSSLVEGEFRRPSELLTDEFFDTFRPLAHGRVEALERMYLGPIRRGGGLPAMLARTDRGRIHALLETLTGPEAGEVFETARSTGDETEIRRMFDRLLRPLENAEG